MKEARFKLKEELHDFVELKLRFEVNTVFEWQLKGFLGSALDINNPIEENFDALEPLKNEPFEERKQIVLNRIKTPDGTILTSTHRHDYVTHTDKNGEWYMTDGGQAYLKRSVNKIPYEDLSLYVDDPFEKVREGFGRGGRGKNGDEPFKWVPLNEMNDGWLKSLMTYQKEHGLENNWATKLYKKEIEYRKKNKIKVKE